jgi:periplasmic protein TonB
MSKDPSTNPPPNKGGQESLEDLIYRASLSEGNPSVRGANPFVSAALTVVFYAVSGTALWYMATQTRMGQSVVKKTIGIDISEQAEEAPPPPPPPPPAPAAPPAPKVEARVDAPPPPPLTNQEVVPDFAPREMPKENLSLAYAGQNSGGAAGSGVAGGGVAGTGQAVAGSGTAQTASRVVDFSFEQMKIKVKPNPPNYPPIARMAKIQGTVIVEIIVGIDGVPVSAKAVEGPPQLRPVSEAYAMQWRFEPAMQNGQPVQSRFKLTMPYRLQQ